MNIPLDTVITKIQELQSKGITVVIIGTQQEIIGIISVADTIQITTVKALNGLKQVGVKQVVTYI